MRTERAGTDYEDEEDAETGVVAFSLLAWGEFVLALLNDFFQLNSSPNISQREITERSRRENVDCMYTQSSLGHLGIQPAQ